MVYGYYPFNPADPKLPKKMMEGQITYPPGVPVSPECKDLIQGRAGESQTTHPPRRSSCPPTHPAASPTRPAVLPTRSPTRLRAGMLHPNPERRAALDDIFQHTWFLKDLPPGALSMNDWCAGWDLVLP